ncbi:MAG: alanine dehydrogenase [Gammaproteobacteria bacterium]|nr:alanine dehydrogenase [Gammaproteobacteria bacterium]
MQIGVPKEIKIHEYRVGLTPASVTELINAGHEVLVEHDAGLGIGFKNSDYQAAGALIVDVDAAFAADLVVKVKEPQLAECARLREGQVLFTYLHLAADAPQAEALMRSGVTAIAYETVRGADGGLPLLTPMSEVAGRMSVQVGAYALQKASGGRGTLLGGVPGVAPGKVVILGGGIAGANAATMAVGLQADVTILDRSVPRLTWLADHFQGRARVLMASAANVREQVLGADLVIGAVLIPGAAAPRLVTREMVAQMADGAAMVDISIDQGGCFETSRPTTHDDPTYMEHGVVHYCVTNMPGAVARTATLALNNVTLPYVAALAAAGWEPALAEDPLFAQGLNVHLGKIRHPEVAQALGVALVPLRWAA